MENALRRLRRHDESALGLWAGEICRLEELEICVRAPADDRAPLEPRKRGKVALEDLSVADVSGLGLAYAAQEILDVGRLQNPLELGNIFDVSGVCFWLQDPGDPPPGSS